MGNTRRCLVVLSVGLACGGSPTGRLPDAALPLDAAPLDALVVDAPLDAMLLPVTLTITVNGVGVSGVRVYFQNADSSVVANLTTDVAGTAQAVMAPGGYVTALNPFAGVPAGEPVPDEVRTFAGVKPGDRLVLTRPGPPDTSEVSMRIVVPGEPAAGIYVVNTTCGAGAIDSGDGVGPSNLISFVGCRGSADILVTANDRVTGEPISALYHPDAAVQADATLDISTETLRPVADVQFRYQNVPQNVDVVEVTHHLMTSRGQFTRAFVDHVEIEVEFDNDIGTAALLVKEPMVQGETGVLGVVSTFAQRNAPHAVVSWGPAAITNTFDLRAEMLAEVLGPPSFSRPTQRLQWIEAGTGATPDFTIAEIQVTRTSPAQIWNWVLAAPYTSGVVAFPTLPTDVSSWNPGVAERVDLTDFANGKVVRMNPDAGGYDAVRAHLLDIQEAGDTTAFVSGGAGRIVLVGPGFPAAIGVPRSPRWRYAGSPARR